MGRQVKLPVFIPLALLHPILPDLATGDPYRADMAGLFIVTVELEPLHRETELRRARRKSEQGHEEEEMDIL